jgi:hypothetical protein
MESTRECLPQEGGALIFIRGRMSGIQNLTFSRAPRLITGAAPMDFNLSKEISAIKPEPVNARR